MLKERQRLHFTLIDPDKQSPEKAGELAKIAQEFCSDAIMIGGSTAGGAVTDDATRAIRSAIHIPTILFPSKATGLSPAADSIFWMMLMNSLDPRFLVGEQMKAAPHLKSSGVKPIPMGYIVISTSKSMTTVERVGKVDRIGCEDVDKTIAYALTAQYYGMECVYLEAGSGADKAVPPYMIEAVKKAIDIPLIVGGGVRDIATASSIKSAGADILVTGTILERDPEMMEGIIRAFRGV